MTAQSRIESRVVPKEHNLVLGPGAYGLLIELAKNLTIPTGRLGAREYTRGISERLQHHLRRRKRAHWHVDYLLAHGGLEAVVAAKTHDRVECALARLLAERFEVVPRFGSSGCHCSGHLFRSRTRAAILDATVHAARSLGCHTRVIEDPGLAVRRGAR